MSENRDENFRSVKSWLSSPRRLKQVGIAIRQAIDSVIDAVRTRRYRIDDLDRIEEAYLVDRVQHEIIFHWGLELESLSCAKVNDVCVCVKFGVCGSWKFAIQVVGKLCVLVTVSDDTSTYSVGLFRAIPEYIGSKQRTDKGKRSISKVGRQRIDWISMNDKLPVNFLPHQIEEARSRLLAH